MSLPAGIRLNPGSAVPPYEQVRQQIAELITSGVLAASARLPPVRQLAADLGLSAGTVARSYQELEGAGLVVTRHGGGTRVAPTPVLTARARGHALATLAQEYVAAARRIGASADQILEAVQHTLTT